MGIPATEIEDYHWQRGQLTKTFFSELRARSCTKWLLVVENVGVTSLLLEYIKNCINSLAAGTVILITTSKDIARLYHPRIEVKGLPEHDAVKLW